jgi:hypothetical protein
MNLGIMEFTAIEVREKRKTILNVIARNNPDNVPAGYTAVYLRENFVQVMPDELIPSIKEAFFNGFEWDMEKRWIKGYTTEENYYQLERDVIYMWLDWAEKHLRNDQ